MKLFKMLQDGNRALQSQISVTNYTYRRLQDSASKRYKIRLGILRGQGAPLRIPPTKREPRINLHGRQSREKGKTPLLDATFKCSLKLSHVRVVGAGEGGGLKVLDL